MRGNLIGPLLSRAPPGSLEGAEHRAPNNDHAHSSAHSDADLGPRAEADFF